jgi:DNA-binding MurR/RpiR family transcriptional regulator
MTIKATLTSETHRFTSAERKVQRCLLANYPAAGLATVAALAKQAGVSDPTVLRFATKLGYSGFSAFQSALIEEVGEQYNSPVSMVSALAGNETAQPVYRTMLLHMAGLLQRAAADLVTEDLDRIVDLLDDEKREIYCVGGRFSAMLAERMAMHLALVRRGVHYVENRSGRFFDLIADFGARTVLVVFDYRRYQPDIVSFARLAHARGASVVLFTDRWMSPAAQVATRTVVSPIETPTAFDTKVAAMAHVDAIVAGLVQRDPERARNRLGAIEEVRQAALMPGQDGALPARGRRRRP